VEIKEITHITDLGPVIVSWLLALIFGLASYHKITSWPRFLASMSAYKILPNWIAPQLAGLALIFGEIAACTSLLALHHVGLILAMILLVLYLGVISINLIRGRTHIDCGCGDEPTPISMLLLVRNLVLVGFAYLAIQNLIGWSSLIWKISIFALASAGLFFGIYMIFEQMLANRGRHQRLWIGEVN